MKAAPPLGALIEGRGGGSGRCEPERCNQCDLVPARQMVAKAVLTKALAVWYKLHLRRATTTLMERTEGVENKKAEAGISMTTVAGIFHLLTGPMLQVVVDLPLPDHP